MDGISVRKAAPDDMPQVRALFERVYRATFSDPVPVFEDATAGERLYVALLGGRIAAMASVWEPDAFIHYLFVDETARRQKAGSALIDRLAQRYDRPLTLKCLVENTNGMAFYRATGWRKAAEGVSREGAYVLWKYRAGPR